MANACGTIENKKAIRRIKQRLFVFMSFKIFATRFVNKSMSTLNVVMVRETNKGNSKLDRLNNPLFEVKRVLRFLATVDLESEDLIISAKT